MALPPEKATEDDPLADAGFLTGLRNGWNALVDVAIVTATVLGAVLPFLIVLAVILVGRWSSGCGRAAAARPRRRRRAPRTASAG